MSDIKRYAVKQPFGVQAVVAHAEGEYVRYADHIAALEALKGIPSGDHEARIKALEKMMIEKVSILDHAFEVDKMLKKRLEALEKALNEHMVKERGTPKRVRPQDTFLDLGECEAMLRGTNGYHITIDPKASPTGIPFEVALAYLKAGRKVKRATWNSGAWYFMDGQNILFQPHVFEARVGSACITHGEVIANDWMVIPKQQ